jgi:hypothetical protein
MKTNSLTKILFSLVIMLFMGLTTIAQDDVLFIEENDFNQIDFSSSATTEIENLFNGLAAGVENGDPGIGGPIDGGLSLLLAAGVGFGAKRLRKSYKK